MAGTSPIEWTDATWNPVVGCTIDTPGCINCYAMKMAGRIEAMTKSLRASGGTGAPHYDGTTKQVKGKTVWTGKLALAPESILTEPLRWKKPRRIFVNSMSDLFHEDAPDEWIDRVFAVMALCPQHTMQVLTKRSARMRRYLSDPATKRRIYDIVCDMVLELGLDVILIAPGVDERYAPAGRRIYLDRWPLPNVWLGVSAEDQKRADLRIPDLLATPAAVRFVSAEPLIGPIDFTAIRWTDEDAEIRANTLTAEAWVENSDSASAYVNECDGVTKLDWIIVGGESGPKARPMHPDWARDIRDDCAAAGVAFFFKQWGEWAPGECANHAQTRTERVASYFASEWSFGSVTPRDGEEMHRDDEPDVWRFGKKRAGRLLDGVEHNGFPEARP